MNQVSNNRLVQWLKRAANRQKAPSNTDLPAFVRQVLDPEEYLSANRDVAEDGVDPVHHWLHHGIFEKRPLSRGKVVILHGKAAIEPNCLGYRFEWMGQRVTIVDVPELFADEALPPDLSHVLSAEELPFVRFTMGNLDREFYLNAYPDVRDAGAEPLAHYLNHGVFEGRRIAPGLRVRVEPGVQPFAWRGTGVTVTAVDEPADGGSEVGHADAEPQASIGVECGSEEQFIAFISEHLDRDAYLSAYEDVRHAGVDLLRHWLDSGIWEGRSISPRVTITIGERAERKAITPVRRFKWRGTTVSAYIKRMSATILSQILAQSRHDGAVVAPGAMAIPALHEFDAIDLMARNDVDHERIFTALAERPDVVLITPFLCAGGAEKYVADLVDALHDAGRGPLLVIVTEHTALAAAGWEKLAILAPLKKARVLFWPDVFGPGYANPVLFARTLSALKANAIVVNNSRLALDAVARFGRGLSQHARLFCTYFSHGVNALGAPYGARFPHRTMRFATTLTDNGPMAALMGKMWGGISDHPVVKLSTKIELADDAVFDQRVEARRRLAARTGHQRRWVWVSRIEPFKGTAVLAALAKLRPQEQFHLYGPVGRSLEQLDLTAPNIIHHGMLSKVLAHDFSEYDGFVFTSLFEGMPNVVLEMSQHAIPLVLADVGGLRETFSERAAIFVSHDESTEATADLFAYALDAVLSMSPASVVDMVTQARADVLREHAPAVFLNAVKTLFNDEHV
jgi:glycosyltransferase involved in cell wall biosynthesis